MAYDDIVAELKNQVAWITMRWHTPNTRKRRRK
jgi:hypothetical protein